MSSLTTATWSPSSFQLRLAFTVRRSPLTVLFLRTRIRKLDQRLRMFSVSDNSSARNNNNRVERRRSLDSWAVNSNSTADSFAGWTNGEQSQESHTKQSVKGVGVVLTSYFMHITTLICVFSASYTILGCLRFQHLYCRFRNFAVCRFYFMWYL